MRARWWLAATTALFVAACGTSGDGRVLMDVSVAGLTEEQNFCFTWQVFQLDETQQWVLVDQETEPVCGQRGVDTKSSLATCYGGRRFLVAYHVTFYEGGASLGTASGTSGGLEEDVCRMNHDTPSAALFQFGNMGDVGGVNPGILIDQVCSNDKLQVEDGRLVTALWLQPDECTENAVPDSYCTLGRGSGLTTLRHGLSADGKIRFVFGESSLDAYWNLFYLSFEPDIPAGALVLEHNPWVLEHFLVSGAYGRTLIDDAVVSFRYEGSVPSVGFVYFDGATMTVVSDQTGDCDGPISLDAQIEDVELPACSGSLVFMGAVPNGVSSFELVLRCGAELQFIGCDALGAGAICG